MAVSQPPRRGDVCLIQLDPTRGSEIRKTRPCLVVSPDELNQHLRTVIVAPMTTGGQAYPWRVVCRFRARAGFIAIDQLRTVDAERISKRLGRIRANTLLSVLNILREMFST
jgi:mRNA interferase MazF